MGVDAQLHSTLVAGARAMIADGLFQRERARLSGSAAGAEARPTVWIREGDDTRQMVIRAERQDRTVGGKAAPHR